MKLLTLIVFILFSASCIKSDNQPAKAKEKKMQQTDQLDHGKSGYIGNHSLWVSGLECWKKKSRDSLYMENNASYGLENINLIRNKVINDNILPASYLHFMEINGNQIIDDIFKKNNSVLKPIFFEFQYLKHLRDFSSKTYSIWTNQDVAFDSPINDVYLSYNKHSVGMSRSSELNDVIVIGNDDDGGLYLLNPTHKIDGEWEAIFLHPHNPGMIRYKTFAHMVASIYLQHVHTENLYYSKLNWTNSCFMELVLQDWRAD
jgi:hypothetical protein